MSSTAAANEAPSSKEIQCTPHGPARYDYDENAKISNGMIVEKKAWMPFIAYPAPITNTALDRVKFKQVACGSHHTVAVTTSGEVYACGLTTRGRIGLSQQQIRKILKIDNSKTPMQNLYELTKVPIVTDLQGQKQHIASAHCGNDFTILLSTDGKVFSSGNGQYGIHCNQNVDGQNSGLNPDLGEKDYAADTSKLYDRDQFAQIPDHLFGGHLVTFVATGENHAALINLNGELWTWGSNSHGQCGIQNQLSDTVCDYNDAIFEPVQPFLVNEITGKSCFVACGGKHTLALTNENTVYSWGNNQYGQLGLALDEFESFHQPRELLFFTERIVSWLGAGSHHSIALTIEGYAYVWGRNDRG